MKKIKSLLAVILAVCLMMSFAVTAFAEDENTVLLASEGANGGATEGNNEVDQPAGNDADKAPEGEGASEGNEAPESEGAPEGDESLGEGEETKPSENTGSDSNTETTGTTETEEVSGPWKTVRVILTVLEVIASLVLVLVVLFQSGKESGLSGTISGNNDTYAGKNGTLDKKLAKATKWVAIAWLVLTLALSLIP